MPVRFYLFPRSNKNGEHVILVSASHKGLRYKTSIGISVLPRMWNSTLQEVRPGSTNSEGLTARVINAALLRIRAYVTDWEIRMLNTDPSLPELKLAVARGKSDEGVANEKLMASISKDTIFRDFDQFVTEGARYRQWAENTVVRWHSLRGHLKAFNPGMTYADFTEEGLDRYMAFLTHDMHFRNSTVQKEIRLIRWFLRWAEKHGRNKLTDYQNYRPKMKIARNQIVFLTREELMKLYSFEVPANGAVVTLHDPDGRPYQKIVSNTSALRKTRDLFCFCCFTSLRYSDMAHLRRSNVFEDKIVITSQKTSDLLPINLNRYAKEILDRYKEGRTHKDLALPVICNPKMNGYLKDLCELCEFNTLIPQVFFSGSERMDSVEPKWKLITTHAARRTFICTALSAGVPPQVVMSWTGHSDYQAMKPYIDVTDVDKAEAMGKIF